MNIHPKLKGKQLAFLNDLDINQLKKGDYHCKACYNPLRTNASRLTDIYIKWAYKCMDWSIAHTNNFSFDQTQVFKEYPAVEYDRMVRQGIATNAKYLGIVEDIPKKPNWWAFTWQGRRFLAGKIQLQDTAWTYQGEVIARSDTYVTVDKVEPEWRKHADYLLDYILLGYEDIQKKKEKTKRQNQLRFS